MRLRDIRLYDIGYMLAVDAEEAKQLLSLIECDANDVVRCMPYDWVGII